MRVHWTERVQDDELTALCADAFEVGKARQAQSKRCKKFKL